MCLGHGQKTGQGLEEGILRCEGLSRLLENEKVSFSREYTSLWESTQAELAQRLEVVETLVVFHRIYYRFDLVKFNVNRGEFAAAARFAKARLEEMRDTLSKV